MPRKLVLMVALAAALLACGPRPAGAEAEMSPKAFRELFIARAQESLPGTRFKRLDDETIEITLPGKQRDRASLRMAYIEYLRRPEDVEEVIDRVIATLSQDEAELAANADRLVVILRPPRPTVEFGPSDPGELISRPFAGDLIQVLAIDSAAAIRYAQPEDLREVGLSEDQAWARALANLPTRMGALEAGPMEDAEDLIAVGADSGLAPSALLLPGACRPGENGPPVLVLARHFFVQPADEAGPTTAGFWRLARFEATSPEAFSRKVIACRDGRWATIEPPAGQP